VLRFPTLRYTPQNKSCAPSKNPPSTLAWNITESIRVAAFCYVEQAESLTGCIQLEHAARDANMAPTSLTKGDHRWQQYRKAFTP
jgi:hypothetical protein